MSVTTRKGDEGRTVLMFHRKAAKDDLRVEACGTVDELNSFLGLAKCATRNKSVRKLVHACQRDLFIVGCELATQQRDLGRLERRISARRVAWLESEIERLEKRLRLRECCFIIPGETRPAALFDVCRAVARRAERLAWTLRRRGRVTSDQVPVYLNRLSDLLWLLARGEERSRARAVAKQ